MSEPMSDELLIAIMDHHRVSELKTVGRNRAEDAMRDVRDRLYEDIAAARREGAEETRDLIADLYVTWRPQLLGAPAGNLAAALDEMESRIRRILDRGEVGEAVIRALPLRPEAP